MHIESDKPEIRYTWAVNSILEALLSFGYSCDLAKHDGRVELVFNRGHESIYIEVPEQDDPENVVADKPFTVVREDANRNESGGWKEDRMYFELVDGMTGKDEIEREAREKLKFWLR